MFEKLKMLSARLDELEMRLSAPDLYDDPARAARLLRERNELEPIVEAYRAYERAQQQLAETQRYNKEMESAQSQQEAEAAYVRDTERRRLVQRQGISGTILTSGLGGLSDTGSRTLTSGVKLGGGGLNG